MQLNRRGVIGAVMGAALICWSGGAATAADALALYSSNMGDFITIGPDARLHGVLGDYLTELAVRAGVQFVGVRAPALRSEREVAQTRNACWAAVVRLPSREAYFSWPVSYPPTRVVIATGAPYLTLEDLRAQTPPRLASVGGAAAETMARHAIPFVLARDYPEAARLLTTRMVDAIAVTQIVLASTSDGAKMRRLAGFEVYPVGLACNLGLPKALSRRLSAAADSLADDPLWRRLEAVGGPPDLGDEDR